jgi:hypothetical protein
MGIANKGTEIVLAANKAACSKLRIDSTDFQHSHYNATAHDGHAFARSVSRQA